MLQLATNLHYGAIVCQQSSLPAISHTVSDSPANHALAEGHDDSRRTQALCLRDLRVMPRSCSGEARVVPHWSGMELAHVWVPEGAQGCLSVHYVA